MRLNEASLDKVVKALPNEAWDDAVVLRSAA